MLPNGIVLGEEKMTMLQGGGLVDRDQDHEEETIAALGDVVQVDHVIVVVRLCQIVVVIEGVAQVDRDSSNNNSKPHDPSQQLNIQLIKHKYH